MMLSRFKTKKTILLLIIAVVLILIFSIPALAQTSMISSSAHRMNETQLWWDQLWESTFNPPPISSGNGIANVDGLENTTNLSIYAFVQPTRFILGIGLIGWLFSYGYKIIESKTTAQSLFTFLRIFLPVFLALLLLANQATYTRVLAYGMRNIINSWSDGIMNLQISDYSIRAAIQDQLITADAKERLVNKFRTCERLEHPEVIIPSATRPDTSDPNVSPITPAQRKVYDYLECWEKVRIYAEEELRIAEEQRNCSGKICKTYKKIVNLLTGYSIGIETLEKYKAQGKDLSDQEVLEEIQYIESKIRFSEGGYDFLSGNSPTGDTLRNFVVSLVNPNKSFLYFTQWMWISTLELALFLNGLFAPIFVSISIVPGKANVLQFWLIETLSIGLGKMIYVVIIGLVAIQQSSGDHGFIDNTFFMSLGIFAPAVSFAMATVGGWAAASSLRGQQVGAVAIAGSAFSSAAASIGYSISREMDKRR